MTKSINPSASIPIAGRKRKKKIELPSLTHWINVEDNHIPIDIWLLLEILSNEGDTELALGYKSILTNTWIGAGGEAIEEQDKVVRYSIITDRNGNAFPLI